MTSAEMNRYLSALGEECKAKGFNLRQNFIKYDSIETGKVSYYEFRNCMEKINPQVDSQIVYKISCPFITQDNRIDYNKFVKEVDHLVRAKALFNELLDQIIERFEAGDTNLFEIFQSFDKSSNGRLSRKEFEDGLQDFGVYATNKEIDAAVAFLDLNGDKMLDYKELRILFDQHCQEKGKDFFELQKSNFRFEDPENYWGKEIMSKIGRYLQKENMTLDGFLMSMGMENNELLSRFDFISALAIAYPGLDKKQEERLLNEYVDPKIGKVVVAKFKRMFEKVNQISNGQPSRQSIGRFAVEKTAEEMLQKVVNEISKSGLAVSLYFEKYSSFNRFLRKINEEDFFTAVQKLNLAFTSEEKRAVSFHLDEKGEGIFDLAKVFAMRPTETLPRVTQPERTESHVFQSQAVDEQKLQKLIEKIAEFLMKEKTDLNGVFRKYDSTDGGYVPAEKLRRIFLEAGLSLDESELELIEVAYGHHQEIFDYRKLVELIKCHVNRRNEAENEFKRRTLRPFYGKIREKFATIGEFFRFYDNNADRTIDKSEFIKINQDFDHILNTTDIVDFFNYLDPNSSGKIHCYNLNQALRQFIEADARTIMENIMANLLTNSINYYSLMISFPVSGPFIRRFHLQDAFDSLTKKNLISMKDIDFLLEYLGIKQNNQHEIDFEELGECLAAQLKQMELFKSFEIQQAFDKIVLENTRNEQQKITKITNQTSPIKEMSGSLALQLTRKEEAALHEFKERMRLRTRKDILEFNRDIIKSDIQWITYHELKRASEVVDPKFSASTLMVVFKALDTDDLGKIPSAEFVKTMNWILESETSDIDTKRPSRTPSPGLAVQQRAVSRKGLSPTEMEGVKKAFQAIVHFMAEDKLSFDELFASKDKSHSGSISKEQLKDALRNGLRLDETRTLQRMIDFVCDEFGRVPLEEFRRKLEAADSGVPHHIPLGGPIDHEAMDKYGRDFTPKWQCENHSDDFAAQCEYYLPQVANFILQNERDILQSMKDVDINGSKRLSEQQIKLAFSVNRLTISLEQVRTIIRVTNLSRDQNYHVNYEEFVQKIKEIGSKSQTGLVTDKLHVKGTDPSFNPSALRLQFSWAVPTLRAIQQKLLEKNLSIFRLLDTTNDEFPIVDFRTSLTKLGFCYGDFDIIRLVDQLAYPQQPTKLSLYKLQYLLENVDRLFATKQLSPEEERLIDRMINNINQFMFEDNVSFKHLFRKYDPSNSGLIHVNDFKKALYEDLHIEEHGKTNKFIMLVSDESGFIELDAFENRLKKKLMASSLSTLPETLANSTLDQSFFGSRSEPFLDMSFSYETQSHKNHSGDEIFSLQDIQSSRGGRSQNSPSTVTSLGCLDRRSVSSVEETPIDLLRQIKELFKANRYSNEEKYKFFDDIDTGKISINTFVEKLGMTGIRSFKDRAKVEELFLCLDVNKNRYLTKREFLTIFADEADHIDGKPSVGCDFERELYKLFKEIDSNNDGAVEKEELAHCLHVFGVNIPADDVASVFTAFDSNKDGKLGFNDFKLLMEQKLEGILLQIEPLVSDARFECTKADTDNDGQLAPFQLEQALAKLGIQLKSEELLSLVRHLDKEMTGKVSIKTFLKFLSTTTRYEALDSLTASALFNIKKYKNISPFDFYTAFKLMPQHFTVSFTRDLNRSRENLPSSAMKPRLDDTSKVCFKDLIPNIDQTASLNRQSSLSWQNSEKNALNSYLKPFATDYGCEIKLVMATGIPFPSVEIDLQGRLIAREIRAILYDFSSGRFVGNVATVMAEWSPEYEDQWHFNPAKIKGEDKLYFRIAEFDERFQKNLAIVFEFVVFYKVNDKQLIEMSAGWTAIDVMKLNKAQSHSLELHGGSPMKMTFINENDVRTNREGWRNVMKKMSKKVASQLSIEVTPHHKLKDSVKEKLSLMPKTILLNKNTLNLLRYAREYLAKVLLDSKNPKAVTHNIKAKTFRNAMDCPDVWSKFYLFWHLVIQKRLDKVPGLDNGIQFLEKCLEHVLLAFSSVDFAFSRSDPTQRTYHDYDLTNKRARLLNSCFENILQTYSISTALKNRIGIERGFQHTTKYKPFDIRELLSDNISPTIIVNNPR